MIKKLFFLLLILGAYMQSQGQPAGTKTGVPPFSILLTSGSHFTYKDLPKDRPLILIYFAPECDHCREFTKKLVGKMGDLKKTQIIMVSYLPVEKLQQFYKDFRLDQFPNVKVGTEGNAFVVPAYFKIVKFPFTAVFDKSGKLAATFREAPSMEVLSGVSKKL
jgi:thiol-disulfide isomerase/thioredoxin